MPRLIASNAFRYATRELRAGDPFDASDADARILLMIGRATEATEVPVESMTEVGGEGFDARPRRRYRRRDMTAEGC